MLSSRELSIILDHSDPCDFLNLLRTCKRYYGMKEQLYRELVYRLFPNYQAHPEDMQWSVRLHQLTLRKAGKAPLKGSIEKYRDQPRRLTLTKPAHFNETMTKFLQLEKWGLKYASVILGISFMANYIIAATGMRKGPYKVPNHIRTIFPEEIVSETINAHDIKRIVEKCTIKIMDESDLSDKELYALNAYEGMIRTLKTSTRHLPDSQYTKMIKTYMMENGVEFFD